MSHAFRHNTTKSPETLSVVIPAHNEESCIDACITTLKTHGGTLHEIIVVDNASSDRTAAAAAHHPGVRVLFEGRRGTSHARQTGTDAATGTLVAYLDADVEIQPSWRAAIDQAFSDATVVLLSGPYRYRGSQRYHDKLLTHLFTISCTIANILTGYIANGGNSVVRRDALYAAGGHNRTLVFYGDDTILAHRMHRIGTTLWNNNFFVYTSARRFDAEGLSLLWRYAVNYWWAVFFHTAFHKTLPANTK